MGRKELKSLARKKGSKYYEEKGCYGDKEMFVKGFSRGYIQGREEMAKNAFNWILCNIFKYSQIRDLGIKFDGENFVNDYIKAMEDSE